METFTKLFGSLLVFVYHCFDRMVILGHIPLLTRPENIVHFFRDVHQSGPITKDVLRKRTSESTVGGRPSPATIRSPSSGRKSACGKRIMSAPISSAWIATIVSAFISF